MRRVAVSMLALASVVYTGFVFQDKNRTPKPYNLLKKIEEARQLVKAESVHLVYGVVGTRRVRVGRHRYKDVPITGITGREMAIAVADDAGAISIVRATKNDSGLHVTTPGFILYFRRENGVNSDIGCERPSGGKVLAVKYPLSNEGNRFGGGGDEVEAVYTPYSGEIRTEEVVKKGIQVQAEFINHAYSKLREREVFSKAFEGRKVVDVIPKNVVSVLLMNEHIDPGDFRSEDATAPLVDKVLTVIGTNREKAYSYAISSAGARGLVQMMPSTYARMTQLYPAAGLMSNFSAGMTDPVNAIMAQVLLCDSDWRAIRASNDISVDRIGPYLAAAYNGGVGRVLSCLSHEQSDWMDSPEDGSQPTKTVTRTVAVKVKGRRGRMTTKYVSKSYTEPIFRAETNKYIRQYHWINNYFADKATRGFKEMADTDEEPLPAKKPSNPN
ncbi:MAG TPA: hypothetical protein VLZ81_07420 [Blastocatellia bacterium]|nr:hypothetical protein [Blastocatellia bacterium]